MINRNLSETFETKEERRHYVSITLLEKPDKTVEKLISIEDSNGDEQWLTEQELIDILAWAQNKDKSGCKSCPCKKLVK